MRIFQKHRKKLIFHPIKLQISIFLMYWAKILAPNPISMLTWFLIMVFSISRATCRKLNWINLESVACYRTLKLRDETRRVRLRDVNDHKISLIPTKRNIEINLIFYVNLIISGDYYLTFNLIKVIYSVNFRRPDSVTLLWNIQDRTWINLDDPRLEIESETQSRIWSKIARAVWIKFLILSIIFRSGNDWLTNQIWFLI